MGLPGVVLALLMLLIVREPKRGGLDPFVGDKDSHAAAPPPFEVIGAFFANRTLLCVAISSGLSAFVGYAMLNWNAPLLMRVKGMSLEGGLALLQRGAGRRPASSAPSSPAGSPTSSASATAAGTPGSR